jgi:hypothetical protein
MTGAELPYMTQNGITLEPVVLGLGNYMTHGHNAG